MPSSPPQVQGDGGALTPSSPPAVQGVGGSLTPASPTTPITKIYLSGSSFLTSMALFPAPTLVNGKQAYTNTGEDLPAYPRTILSYRSAEDLYYLELSLSASVDYTWEQANNFLGTYAPFDGDPGPPVGSVITALSRSDVPSPPAPQGAPSNSPSGPPAVQADGGSISPSSPPSIQP